ncbi:MAG: RNA polymerase sigma factor [Candidatus Wallbacteria bacterium]
MREEANKLYLKYTNGSMEAFSDLVRLIAPRFYRLFRHLGADAADSEDYCQEFFFTIYRAGKTFSKDRDFMPWAYAIARNIFWKERERSSKLKIIPLAEWVASREKYCYKYEISDILAKLPEEKRIVFELKHFSGLKFDEIAKILKIPVGTVKSRMFSAVMNLKEIISRSGI